MNIFEFLVLYYTIKRYDFFFFQLCQKKSRGMVFNIFLLADYLGLSIDFLRIKFLRFFYFTDNLFIILTIFL